MPTISKIALPSGNIYELKDAYAREVLAGGIKMTVCYDGTDEPVVSNIPEGVVVEYEGQQYTGTKPASTAEPLTFYLVKVETQESREAYDEYAAADRGGVKFWEKIGDTQIDLSQLGLLAYKDNVTLIKGVGDKVLGEATTFSTASSLVSFSEHTTKNALGANATFNTVVTPTTVHLKATASGTDVSASGTADAITSLGTPTDAQFVSDISKTSGRLVKTSINNVTNAGTASTWSFTLGSGEDAETLIITGNNGVAPTLSEVAVANGAVAVNGTGDSILADINLTQSSALTGLGTPAVASVITGVRVSSQPTIILSAEPESDANTYDVVSNISSSTTSVNNADSVSAITELGTGSAAAQTITVGDNDKVTVAKYGDLTLAIS